MSSVRSLIIQASTMCPCYCPGCYNFMSDNEISTDLMLDFIEKFVKAFGVSKITVSGGDPLLRSDIAIFLERLNELKCKISIDTVCTSVNKNKTNQELIVQLKKIEIIGLPLDGVTDEVIQIFRKNITYEECIDAIKISNELGMKICINTVVHSKNIYQILSVADVINELSFAGKWQLFQYMPIGPGGVANKDFFSISEKEFNEVEQKLSQYNFRENLEIQCKSSSYRKNKYIMLGCDGKVWFPKQSMTYQWENTSDENSERIIVGTVEDKNIIKKIEKVIEV